MISLLLVAAIGLNWRVLLIILPLIAYFIIYSVKLTTGLQVFTKRYAEILHPVKINFYLERFSLTNFLLQPSLAFRITLVMFVLTTAAVIAYQPIEFLSPVP